MTWQPPPSTAPPAAGREPAAEGALAASALDPAALWMMPSPDSENKATAAASPAAEGQGQPALLMATRTIQVGASARVTDVPAGW